MRYLGILLVAFGISCVAHAAEDVCKADREQLCKGVVPGANHMTQCLATKEAKLSPACKKFRDDLKQRIATVKEPCQDDFAALCSDKKSKDNQIRRCLAQNFNNLSMSCRNHIRNQRRVKRLQNIKKSKANGKEKETVDDRF